MAKREGAASKWASDDRQTNFRVLNFWVTSPKGAKTNTFFMLLLILFFEELAASAAKYCSKRINVDLKSQKSGFHSKVKSPKMGLPITPRQLSKRPTLFLDIWPR